MRSVEAVLALARWRNALIAAAGVALGAWWATGGVNAPVAWAALAAIGLTGAANAWNDIADIEIDRMAHPDRPLPSGRLTTRAALRVGLACALASVVLSAAAHPALGALTVLVLALMRAYSPWLKRTGLPGNVVVAVLAALPFLYGAWAAGRPAAGAALVLIGAPLHLARELAKDLDDATADAAARRTLPVRFGAATARRAVAAATIAFVAMFVTLLLRVRGPDAARGVPFALTAVAAIFLSAAATRAAWSGRPGGPGLFKAAMLCAMAAVATSRI